MSDHLYDLPGAARAFGVSADSIRRRLRAGELRGAHRAGDSSNAAWLIPHSALLAAGFEPRVRPVQGDGPADTRLAVAEARVEELRSVTKAQSEQIRALQAVVEQLAGALAGLHRSAP